MSSSLPLILREDPVPRGQLGPVRAHNKDVAVVYATAAGELDLAGSTTLTWKEKLLGKYVARFEVLVGDQRRKAKLVSTPITCADGSHRFEVTLDVGFRVDDPTEVVRRRVADALPVVYGHLVPQLRSAARKFDIDQAAQAEDHINQLLGHPISLPEGITIYYCSVEIERDEAARAHGAALRAAERQTHVTRGAHQAQIADARLDQALLDIAQDAELNRQTARRDALGGMSIDMAGVLRQHLIMHPEDTGRVLDLLAQGEADATTRADLEAQRRDQLFRFLVDKDLIRSADLSMLGGSAPAGLEALTPKQLPAPAAPADPLKPPADQPPAPVIWGGRAAHDAPAPARQCPVYLVLDASAAAAPLLPGLNTALRDLNSALTADPDALGGLRLAVLAFTERSEVLRPLSRVAPDSAAATLSASGEARYGAAFDGLTDLLSADVDALKAGDHRVQRPVVVFLSTGWPSDDSVAWASARDRLASHRYAPTVIACGLGSTTASAMLRVAARPEVAFVAAPDASPAEHVAGFALLLRNTVLGLARALRSGPPDLVVECPAGLRPAAARD
jgi:uncharacterized protein YegL